EHGPEQRMVGVTTAVVTNDGANVFRHRIQVAQQVFDGLVGQLGMLLQRRVGVVDIGLVVLGVMDLHRTSVDVRLQRVVRVWQRRQFERHGRLLQRGYGLKQSYEATE